MPVISVISNSLERLKQGEFNEYIIESLSDYEQLGPLPGILLPFIESILPFLPLLLMVLANSAAYGLIKGFLYSWVGTSVGSVFVFYMIRTFRNKRFFMKIRKNKQVKKVTTWVDLHGFGPLFLLLCFPFSPSSVINIVAALSHIRGSQFILAVILGKAAMVFSISYIGDSLLSFAQNPLKTFLVCGGIGLFWIVGKQVEKNLNNKVIEK